MKKALFDVLVCPLCQGKLNYHSQNQTLTCAFDRLVFSIQDDMPIMLPELATPLDTEQASDTQEKIE